MQLPKIYGHIHSCILCELRFGKKIVYENHVQYSRVIQNKKDTTPPKIPG